MMDETVRLLERLALGDTAKNIDEINLLHKLSRVFDQKLPVYACPKCWLTRLVNSFHKDL